MNVEAHFRIPIDKWGSWSKMYGYNKEKMLKFLASIKRAFGKRFEIYFDVNKKSACLTWQPGFESRMTFIWFEVEGKPKFLAEKHWNAFKKIFDRYKAKEHLMSKRLVEQALQY